MALEVVRRLLAVRASQPQCREPIAEVARRDTSPNPCARGSARCPRTAARSREPDVEITPREPCPRPPRRRRRRRRREPDANLHRHPRRPRRPRRRRPRRRLRRGRRPRRGGPRRGSPGPPARELEGGRGGRFRGQRASDALEGRGSSDVGVRGACERETRRAPTAAAAAKTHQARIADEQRLEAVGEGDAPVQALVPLGLGDIVRDLHGVELGRARGARLRDATGAQGGAFPSS